MDPPVGAARRWDHGWRSPHRSERWLRAQTVDCRGVTGLGPSAALDETARTLRRQRTERALRACSRSTSRFGMLCRPSGLSLLSSRRLAAARMSTCVSWPSGSVIRQRELAASTNGRTSGFRGATRISSAGADAQRGRDRCPPSCNARRRARPVALSRARLAGAQLAHAVGTWG